jgi:hypothetical protein
MGSRGFCAFVALRSLERAGGLSDDARAHGVPGTSTSTYPTNTLRNTLRNTLHNTLSFGDMPSPGASASDTFSEAPPSRPLGAVRAEPDRRYRPAPPPQPVQGEDEQTPPASSKQADVGAAGFTSRASHRRLDTTCTSRTWPMSRALSLGAPSPDSRSRALRSPCFAPLAPLARISAPTA